MGRAPSPAAFELDFARLIGTASLESKILTIKIKFKFKSKFKSGGRGRPPHTALAPTLATGFQPPEEGRAGCDSGNGQAGTFHRTIQFSLPSGDLERLGIVALRRERPFKGRCDHLRQVQGMAVGRLGDLFAATEAVGDDEAVGWGLADRRQEFQFADRHRHVVFLLVESERAGHAATTRRRGAPVHAHFAENGLLIGHFHERLVMAMAVDEGLDREVRQLKVGGFPFQKFT